MNFRIDDILNGTIGGVSKEVLESVILEVVDGEKTVVGEEK